MALSPGIPTSFVPKQPVQSRPGRSMTSGRNLFLFVSLCVAGASIAAAGGTFVYAQLLDRTLASKQAELATAQTNVDENTIEEFVRLRDRLDTGEQLLTNHILLSQFFDVLESITLQSVRYNSMSVTVAGDHTAKLTMSGTAKNFNALAAQSNSFAAEKRIKRAIFSGISVDEKKLISFDLTADIDPKLVIEGSADPAKPASLNTTTTAPVNDTPPSSATVPTATTPSPTPTSTASPTQTNPSPAVTTTPTPAKTTPTAPTN